MKLRHIAAGMDETKKRRRGFAAMDPKKRREIASKGEKATPTISAASLRTPNWRPAPPKGGKSVQGVNRSFSKDPALASEAGRKGGQASHGKKGAEKA